MENREKQGFVVMAKPAGSACNLRCRYCYYLDAGERTGKPEQRLMTDATLERFIASYIGGVPGPVVQFHWHGGEPTLAGLPFFEKAVALEKKYLPEGWQCINNLQTNGLLLDDAWCAFLKKEQFDVGLSIDGSEEVHDTFRLQADGSPTYGRTVETAERLLRFGVMPDLLCTVTADSCRNPMKVYRALKSLHSGWVQFIPIIVREGLYRDNDCREGQTLTPESVTPEAYGKFLTAIFDEWVCHDLGVLDVQLFAEMALVLSGGQSSLCTLTPDCGRVVVVEHDGQVYSCDHFVDSAHDLGNLNETPLEELVNSRQQEDFGREKSGKLAKRCTQCPYLKLCYGNCRKDRFLYDQEDENGYYFLCDGLRKFFDHAVPILKEVIRESGKGIPRGTIMANMRSAFKKKQFS